MKGHSATTNSPTDNLSDEHRLRQSFNFQSNRPEKLPPTCRRLYVRPPPSRQLLEIPNRRNAGKPAATHHPGHPHVPLAPSFVANHTTLAYPPFTHPPFTQPPVAQPLRPCHVVDAMPWQHIAATPLPHTLRTLRARWRAAHTHAGA